MSLAHLEVVAISGGHQFARGPAWHADGYLLFCEQDRILFWTEEGTKTFRRNAGTPRDLAINENGDLLVAEGAGSKISYTPHFGSRTVWSSVQNVTSLSWLDGVNALATTESDAWRVGSNAQPTIAKTQHLMWASRCKEVLVSVNDQPNRVGIHNLVNLDQSSLVSFEHDIIQKAIQVSPSNLVLMSERSLYLVDISGKTHARTELHEPGTGICTGPEGQAFVTCENSVYRLNLS